MAETYPEPTEMEQRGFLGSAEAVAGVPPAVLSAPLELTLSRTVFSYPPRKRSPLISKTRCGPAIICLSLDAMLKAVNAREFDMVASWSVDRLGRSLTDLLSILQGLHDKGVDLFLHQQGLDTSTTAGKAMFQMLGVFAEFERGIIRERVNAGLARARANGTRLGRRP